MVAQRILHKVLDYLESEEVQLLVWGDTGGVFTEEEVLTHIATVAPEEDSDDILDALLDQVMIYQVPGSSLHRKTNYRTRMGEAVHLFRNLRQWFHGRPVTESKPLVSDYRFLRRARSYPRRDRVLSDLLGRLAEAGIETAKYEKALKLQVGDFQLSSFQERATERILLAYEKHKDRKTTPSATIICAGTGSGKTMAFYLPGLSAVVDSVLTDSSSRVRVLAIYPRNELLKDQFNETWIQCRKLDSLLEQTAGRKLRIGAFYGDTPHSPRYVHCARGNYDTHWLKCSTPNCQGEMRWLRNDIERGVERLICSVCKSEASGDALSLTRESMAACLPDIVFTTTEMLNTHLVNPKWKRILGVHSTTPPPLVLLDEVHTYEGNQGAQVAFLLRRWMKVARTGPHFVGLSATLSDAEAFFERLTGANRSRVRLIQADGSEMVEEGAEYLLALRGDPVSQTALLSTTIQSAMLMRRLLDPADERISHGTWGKKTFLFTDNLDVTNRLFWQLADAEGWWFERGNIVMNRNGPLAALRNPDGDTTRKELQDYGQDWGVAKTLGFSLDEDDRGSIARTSSQDKGVDSDAELIVATASLEVGYNDPEVGAVIQHKAPRNVASYLQRKGRAGRPRAMRPWTIVVLSDFGRDRVVYQHYEKLLSPEIKLQRLPIGNSHIHRMQSAMSVLDWLSAKVNANVWGLFNKPKMANASVLKKVMDLVDRCMVAGSQQDELLEYIRSALKLDEESVNRVFWQSPRSILLEFLPTIRRRIDTDWAAWNQSTETIDAWVEANKSWRSPVPEYIPDNMFSDLNLPTLNVALKRGENTLYEQMSFFQGLQEFAPGRISKRFSVKSAIGADWLVPEAFDPSEVESGAEVVFEVETAFSSTRTYLGNIINPVSGEELILSQPHFVKSKVLPSRGDLTETSNAQLWWRTVFQHSTNPESHVPPRSALWSRSLRDISFFLHRNQTQLEVIRFNTGSRAELKFRHRGAENNKKFVDFKWTDQGRPAAMGTRLWVDAMRCVFQVTDEDLRSMLTGTELVTTLRASFFQDGIRGFKRFRDDHFSADWVYECVIAAIALEMQLHPRAIDEIVSDVLDGESKVTLVQVPRLVFQTQLGEGEEEDSQERELVRQLEDLLHDKALREELKTIGNRLFDPLSSMEEAVDWCREVLSKTLASAVQNAMGILLPNADEQAVIADATVDGDCITIYLSEQESGGAGIITQLQEQYVEDPVGMLNVIAQTLRASEYEQLDEDVRGLLDGLEGRRELRRCFASVRSSATFSERVRANAELKRTLRAEGFHVSHSFSAVLYSRVLRPGSNENTDLRLTEALTEWVNLEGVLGFELPLNITTVAQIVKEEGGIDNPSGVYAKACRLQGILWPRGVAIRQYAVQTYNRFDTSNTRTERTLGAYLCVNQSDMISANDALWLELTHAKLLKEGRVDIVVPREIMGELNRILVRLQTVPLDAMGLLFYPRCAGMYRKCGGVVLRTEFAEVAH